MPLLSIGRKYLALLFLLVFLPACSTTLYFHDDEVEKLSKEALTSFEKVDPEAMFNGATKNLQTSLENEQVAALRRLTAKHEFELARLIDGINDKPAADQLISLVDHRLNYILGAETAETLRTEFLNKKGYFKAQQVGLKDLQKDLLTEQRTVSDYWQIYKDANGKRENSCSSPLENDVSETPHPEDNDSTKNIYASFFTSCSSFKELETKVNAKRKKAFFSKTELMGEMDVIDRERKQLDKEKKDIKKAREKLKEGLDNLKKQLEEAQAPEKEEKERKKKLDEFSKKVNGVLDALEEGSGAVDKIKDISDSKIDLSPVKGVIDTKDGWVGKLLRAEILETNLEAVLNQVGESKIEPETEEDKIALQYKLLTLSALHTLPKLKGVVFDLSNLPSQNSILIGLAYQRYQIKTQTNNLTLLSDRHKITKIRQRALEREVVELWKTREAAKTMKTIWCGKTAKSFVSYFDACKNDPNARSEAARALVAFDQAWVMGIAVEYRAVLYEVGGIQNSAIAQTKENAKVWVNILKPAVQELVSYGEGGIKDETIANLVQALGLTAIAAGVN